jgi:predicted permease
MDRVRMIPGVEAAAEVDIVPMSGSGWNNRVVVNGMAQSGISNFNRVSPAYFRALGTPFVSGRDFQDSDTRNSLLVAIVNESFARKYFNANALGQSFQIEEGPGTPRPFYHIVGVVKDTKYMDLREPFTPIAFLAASQEKELGAFLRIVLRSNSSLTGVAHAVTHALTEVNPAIIVEYQTMAAQVRNSLVRERLMAALSGFFGGLAALIAMIGLYGVMSYTVARRKVEIGIRMALGANRQSVVAMIVREAGMLLGSGVIIGAVLAIAAAKAASTLLYGLEPWDPMTVALAMLALASVSVLASWLPAHRASRVEPTIALREE